jgi:hypothetical protein
MNDEEITVTLSVREARALAFCANLLGEVFAAREDEDEPAAGTTGAMKLEVALVQVGAPV